MAKDLFIMRIISGICRGRKLNTLEGDNTRPTADRVKESVFNILGTSVIDRKVLDLFAGSGALGLEALSRGAVSCVFVDSSKAAMKVIESNIEGCRFQDRVKTYLGEFKSVLGRSVESQFDLVFLDPPYHKELGIEALQLLSKAVSDEGIVILETDGDELVPEVVGSFERYDVRNYGRIKVSFFTKVNQ